MNAIPLTLTEANQFIEKHHRHHHKVPRDKFRVGCEVGGKLVGVATVGQPLARLLCDGYTLEVTRLCTDGTKGVCSFLYRLFFLRINMSSLRPGFCLSHVLCFQDLKPDWAQVGT